MIDIHHHLLWGMDDGPKDIAESVGMARLAAQDGITHVVCTPHANSTFAYRPAEIAAKTAELRSALTAEKVNLTLGVGADFHLSYDNIVQAKKDPGKYSINGLGYLLIELPDHGIPRNLLEVFYDFQLAGLTPILTHPERNATLQRSSQMLMEWLRGGMLVQITADSLLGRMGKEAERTAHRLLAKRWVHFLASDAHGTVARPPRMKAAAAMVAKKYGAGYADSLVTTNPQAVFEGRAFEIKEEPLDLYEEHSQEHWLHRLLTR